MLLPLHIPQIAEFLEDCDSRAPQGTERGSRLAQGLLDVLCAWVRAAKHAPRDPSRVLERRHGLAEIVELGIGTQVASQ